MPIKLNTASGGGVILTGANTASDKTITVPADDGTMIYANSSGNVGIGTTPAAGVRLDVRNNSTTTLADMRNANSAGYGIYIAAGGSTSQYVQRWADYNNNALATIDGAGNLLVGTTTKSGKITSNSGTAFDPGASGNITNTAFTAIGNYGGGVSVIDGTQGYTMWSQNAGADLYLRRATTSSIHTGGVYISNAAGSWSAASDERLKNIIRPIENAVKNLSGLRCVIGEYKDNVGAHHPFLIAQDVQAVFPEVVNQMDDQGHLGMSYTDMVPILIKAIQEQQQMIETLQAKVAALEAK